MLAWKRPLLYYFSEMLHLTRDTSSYNYLEGSVSTSEDRISFEETVVSFVGNNYSCMHSSINS